MIDTLNALVAETASQPPAHKLYNPQALTPPRPTISNLQWISGTQYVTPSDMDILSTSTSIPVGDLADNSQVGGPGRPPSKRMIDQMRSEEQQRRMAARPGASATTVSATANQDEGYWAYMQRQVQERTERLGMMSENMDRLGENSSGYLDDVSKFVNQQKRKAVLGGKTSSRPLLVASKADHWLQLLGQSSGFKAKFPNVSFIG